MLTSCSVEVKCVDGTLVRVKVVAREEHGRQQEDALVFNYFDKVSELVAHRCSCLNFYERTILPYYRARR